MDPIWERFHDNESWNVEPKTPTHARAPEVATALANTTPTYAIGATTTINKAIDIWIDDNTVNGGNISERNVVDGYIVADWGARVRNRLAERRKSNKTTKNQDVVIGGNGPSNYTPMSIIERNILSPDTDSSPERDVGDLNNLRFQNPGGQEPNDNDDDDDDPYS